MKILLTNDDGIYAPGIHAVYLELKKLGEVIVVAPDSERSSVGHGITLAHPIRQKPVNRKGEYFGIGVSGMPADCVKFAVDVIFKGEKPDMLVSGINLGPNEGCSVFYSGTVAGAREGALMGIPSIAISLDTFTDPDFSFAARCGRRVAEFLTKHPVPTSTFLNVNVPHCPESEIQGIRFTKQCLEPIHGTFVQCKDPNAKDYYWLTGKLPVANDDNTIDTYAMHNRYVTITPTHCDSTDYDVYKTFETFEF